MSETVPYRIRDDGTPHYPSMDSLDKCEAFYWAEIAPAMETDGLDPDTETPTYNWLNSQYPGFVKHLKREFDLSPGQFYDEYGIPPEQNADESLFAFVEDSTRDAIEDYLEELATRRGRAESTVSTRRSILRQYLLAYEDVHGTTDVLSPLFDITEQSGEMNRVADVFDALRGREDALTTLPSKQKYVQEVRQFYNHLLMFGRAEYNPTLALETRFGWDTTPNWDNPALESEQIEALFEVADTLEHQFIVVGVCGWGLRPSEVAGLHVEQLPGRDGLTPTADPHIKFEEDDRKNGEGTVALLAGFEILHERLDELEGRDDWNGYLLPSETAKAGHRTTQTIERWFTSLAEEAGVTVKGETPTPKYGRRFWYKIFTRAGKQIADLVADVAEEQGSKDPQVVIDNYLSETDRRQLRCEAMRNDLEGLFTNN